MYNCNLILALSSVCLVALAGWTARPDACEGMLLVFHKGTLQSCLGVTDTGLVRLGSVDDCPNECDGHHHRAAIEGRRRMSLDALTLLATSAKDKCAHGDCECTKADCNAFCGGRYGTYRSCGTKYEAGEWVGDFTQVLCTCGNNPYEYLG